MFNCLIKYFGHTRDYLRIQNNLEYEATTKQILIKELFHNKNRD